MGTLPSCVRIALLASICFTGCSERQPDPLYPVRVELMSLKQELLLLREQMEENEPRIAVAESIAQQVLDERLAPTSLDCSRPRSAIVPTPIATMDVRCEQLLHSNNGYRLRLRVGNPTAGRLEQVGFTVYAGPGASRGRSERRYFEESPHPIMPGSSHLVVIELPELPPRDAQEMAISVRIGRVSLVQR